MKRKKNSSIYVHIEVHQPNQTTTTTARTNQTIIDHMCRWWLKDMNLIMYNAQFQRERERKTKNKIIAKSNNFYPLKKNVVFVQNKKKKNTDRKNKFERKIK